MNRSWKEVSENKYKISVPPNFNTYKINHVMALMPPEVIFEKGV